MFDKDATPETLQMLDSVLTIYHYDIDVFAEQVWGRERQCHRTRYTVRLWDEGECLAAVSAYTLTWAFRTACEKAEIINAEFLQERGLT